MAQGTIEITTEVSGNKYDYEIVAIVDFDAQKGGGDRHVDSDWDYLGWFIVEGIDYTEISYVDCDGDVVYVSYDDLDNGEQIIIDDAVEAQAYQQHDAN